MVSSSLDEEPKPVSVKLNTPLVQQIVTHKVYFHLKRRPNMLAFNSFHEIQNGKLRGFI